MNRSLAVLAAVAFLSGTSAWASDTSLSQQLGIQVSPGCAGGMSINDLPASYTAEENAQFYPYGKMDSAALIKGLAASIGAPPPGTPVYVVLGYVPGEPGGAYIYLFDAGGCFDADTAQTTAALSAVWMGAGLALPYGDTFFKIPGAPQ